MQPYGDTWLFCCARPMVYVGSWSPDAFDRHAPDGDGRAFFYRVLGDAPDGLWEGHLRGALGVYVFRCPGCGRHRGYWDCD